MDRVVREDESWVVRRVAQKRLLSVAKEKGKKEIKPRVMVNPPWAGGPSRQEKKKKEEYEYTFGKKRDVTRNRAFKKKGEPTQARNRNKQPRKAGSRGDKVGKKKKSRKSL